MTLWGAPQLCERMSAVPRIVVGLAALFALVGCETGESSLAPGQRLKVTSQVMAWRQDYLHSMGPGGGAFAVSLSGRSAAYYYCPADRCLGGKSVAAGRAIKMCERDGETCILFDSSGSIDVPYDVVQ
jgi:hypothetical protein